MLHGLYVYTLNVNNEIHELLNHPDPEEQVKAGYYEDLLWTVSWTTADCRSDGPWEFSTRKLLTADEIAAYCNEYWASPYDHQHFCDIPVEWAQSCIDRYCEENQLKIHKFEWGNDPSLVPVSDGHNWNEFNIIACGQNPFCEENVLCELVQPWNGFRAGSVVMTGLTCKGHPFYIIESTK